MKFRTKTILILILILFCVICSYSQNKDDNFYWNNYKSWQNKTRYTRTYIVNQKHPCASDTNKGSFDVPLKTINQAAQLVKEGERVLIYSGIYRETIFPKNSEVVFENGLQVNHPLAPENNKSL